jgi:hypothetical protein
MGKNVTGTQDSKIKNSVCPPLTTSDIVTLRGKPMVKIIKPNKKGSAKSLYLPQKEEWVYLSVHDNSTEHYFFVNEFLLGWRKDKQ